MHIDKYDKTTQVNSGNRHINNDQKYVQEYTNFVAEISPSVNQNQTLASSHSYISCLQNVEKVSKDQEKIAALGFLQQNENTDQLEGNDSIKQDAIVNITPAYPALASHCTIIADNTITHSNDQQAELQEPLERDITDYSWWSVAVPFLKIMDKINLPHCELGMCWPLAQKACQHCTLGMGAKHMEIVESVYDMFEDEESLSDEKRYQALAFLDEVAIAGVSHGSSISYAVMRAMKDCYKETPDAPKWKEEAENEQICVKEVMNFTQFSCDEIQEFLQKIKDDNGNKSWSMMISYVTHAVSIGFDGTKWLACNHNQQVYANDLSFAVRVIFDEKYVTNSRAYANLKILEKTGDNLVVNKQAKKNISKIKSINISFFSYFLTFIVDSISFFLTAKLFIHTHILYPLLKFRAVLAVIKVIRMSAQKVKQLISSFLELLKRKLLSRLLKEKTDSLAIQNSQMNLADRHKPGTNGTNV